MRRPTSIVGTIAQAQKLFKPVMRRLILAILIVVALILSIFPRNYVALVQLNQPSSSAAGLGTLLGQLGGNYGALLGGGQTYEVDLAVGRSIYVQTDVIRKMGLIGKPGFRNMREALKTIERTVSIDSLRGAIIRVSVRSTDKDFALRLANGYTAAFQKRLAILGREQTAYKRRILNDRLAEANNRLSAAQSAVNRFKAANRLPDPESQLASSVSSLTSLQSRLQQEESDLRTLLSFRTPDNFTAKQLIARIAATKAAIAATDQNESASVRPNAAKLAAMNNDYNDLLRDLSFAQSLYLSYTKYLEGAAVEDESSDWNLQVLQPAYIDAGIAFDSIWLAIAICLAIAFVSVEFYVFAPPMYQGRTATRTHVPKFQ